MYQLSRPFLFFHASAPLPSGSTNPWTLQTGSMRVRGQTSVVCFPPFLLLSHSLSPFPSPTISPTLLPIEKHLILSSPHVGCRARRLTARIPPLKTSSFLLSPALHLSCCPIWCCLSSCHYLCPMCLYHLAAVTSICEAALVSALLMRSPHALTALCVWCQHPTGHSSWCLWARSHWCHRLCVGVTCDGRTGTNQNNILRFIFSDQCHVVVLFSNVLRLLLFGNRTLRIFPRNQDRSISTKCTNW